MSQFGALASLAGVSLGVKAKSSRRSRCCSLDFLRKCSSSRNDLLPILYPKLWDSASGRWKSQDPKLFRHFWKADVLFQEVFARVVQIPRPVW